MNDNLVATGYSCNSYGLASDSYDRLPYLQCRCYSGFNGNPYLGQGYQELKLCHVIFMSIDINECEDPKLTDCHRKCLNKRGYWRTCWSIAFPSCVRWLCRAIRRRKKMKLKQKFFKQNGGLLLQQQSSLHEGNVEKDKLFNSKEFGRATDNFNENRILGQGDQGTVYRGMLIDRRIVAIKKCKCWTREMNEFKLLGCCLETEVPLLVCEFIPNGMLYQYLHDPNEEIPVPWDVHLLIATEVAGALSYLHSAVSIPIYHRDIKTTNIILDAKYRAKIADFGTSRSVALSQTHVTTLVQGNFRYLDPEYFQPSQFTDKSNVYSFGGVLVELLTGQKPILH
ncbi:hypothetical protein CRG98_045752 [Punica granatum]|uniref:Protein kinase domain-containing protein n=1 Tax=Punica granatum TaxID=22663 RepID=A0A2I0HQ72_PUNGR|nr:hypothetical protein CRG98_045752 [Punica granatum]